MCISVPVCASSCAGAGAKGCGHARSAMKQPRARHSITSSERDTARGGRASAHKHAHHDNAAKTRGNTECAHHARNTPTWKSTCPCLREHPCNLLGAMGRNESWCADRVVLHCAHQHPAFRRHFTKETYARQLLRCFLWTQQSLPTDKRRYLFAAAPDS